MLSSRRSPRHWRLIYAWRLRRGLGERLAEIAAASTEEIQRLARRSDRSQAGEAVTRGLTSSETQATARYELIVRTLPDRGECTALSKISAHLAVPKLTIHIDSRNTPAAAVLGHPRPRAGARAHHPRDAEALAGPHAPAVGERSQELARPVAAVIQATADQGGHRPCHRRPGPADPSRRRPAACRDQFAGNLRKGAAAVQRLVTKLMCYGRWPGTQR